MESLTVYVLCGFALLLQILTWAIFIRAILSWFPISRSNPVIDVLDRFTEPVIAPLRRVVPTVGMIDITPLVALLLFYFIRLMIHSTVPCPF